MWLTRTREWDTDHYVWLTDCQGQGRETLTTKFDGLTRTREWDTDHTVWLTDWQDKGGRHWPSSLTDWLTRTKEGDTDPQDWLTNWQSQGSGTLTIRFNRLTRGGQWDTDHQVWLTDWQGQGSGTLNITFNCLNDKDRGVGHWPSSLLQIILYRNCISGTLFYMGEEYWQILYLY